MFDLENFLLMRELRVETQMNIIDKYKNPIVILRANYPGENKNSFIANQIIKIIKKEIIELFNENIVYNKKLETIEGVTYIFSIAYNGHKLKETAIKLENSHILGRFVDIDVYDYNKHLFSRKEFGSDKRNCFICDKMAFICARENTHTLNELIKSIEDNVSKYLLLNEKNIYFSNYYSNLAKKSLIFEVSASPSFGLVSPFTSGAHNDMDFFTFINSAFSLDKYFKDVVRVGYSSLPIELIFSKIRYMGKVAEKSMFKATNNINTHKGIIFLMGITLSAIAKVKYEKLSFDSIPLFISDMCKNILDDFKNISKKSTLTHGEKLFLKHGVTGVRGVVKDGLNIVFNGSLLVLENSLAIDQNLNTAMIKVLLFLMENLEDTTILHRHNYDILINVQKNAKYLTNQLYNNMDINLLNKIEKEYILKNISPGGAADLLAITLLLYYIKKDF